MGSCRKCHTGSAFRIYAQIQNLAVLREIRCLISRTRTSFHGARVESFSLREIRHAVHVRTFAAPAALTPARFKIRGGRANRRRCARWRRFPSDCRVKPRSNMRIVVLCRNFSSGALLSRSLRTREIRTNQPQVPKAKHVSGLQRTG